MVGAADSVCVCVHGSFRKVQHHAELLCRSKVVALMICVVETPDCVSVCFGLYLQ